jgi:hypothetical protein
MVGYGGRRKRNIALRLFLTTCAHIRSKIRTSMPSSIASGNTSERDAICANPIVVAPDPTIAGFLGAVIRLSDGSQWKLTETLSRIKYQDTDPPYEAVQVFISICLEDPSDSYNGIEEAVMKVKYQ